MKTIYNKISERLSALKDIPLLLMRLILAYGFYTPAIMKLKNMESIGEWYGSLGIPLPLFSAYLSGVTEISGIVLLVLGLGTRIASIPLIIMMVVAIITVHIGNGFEAGDNGFEIPIYYIIMLFTLIIYGSGRISIDNLIKNRVNK